MLKRKPHRNRGEDLRDFPTYTIPEAALFLGVPPRTVHRWFSGTDPVLAASGSVVGFPLLSFRDALDAYALFLLRARHGFSMQTIKRYLREAERHTQSRHYISEHLSVFRNTLLLDRPGRGERARQVIDLSRRGGQMAMPDIVDVFANRVLKSSSGKMLAVFPWRLWRVDQESKPVQIDPEVMSGRLVLTGTRIPAQMIWDRARRGQSAQFIADDYGIAVDLIEKALQHSDTKAA